MSRAPDDAMPVGTMAGTPQVLLSHHLKALKLPTKAGDSGLARLIIRTGWALSPSQ